MPTLKNATEIKLPIPHYVCTGGCKMVSPLPSKCTTAGCPRARNPLTECRCENFKHQDLLNLNATTIAR